MKKLSKVLAAFLAFTPMAAMANNSDAWVKIQDPSVVKCAAIHVDNGPIPFSSFHSFSVTAPVEGVDREIFNERTIFGSSADDLKSQCESAKFVALVNHKSMYLDTVNGTMMVDDGRFSHDVGLSEPTKGSVSVDPGAVACSLTMPTSPFSGSLFSITDKLAGDDSSITIPEDYEDAEHQNDVCNQAKMQSQEEKKQILVNGSNGDVIPSDGFFVYNPVNASSAQ
jgi:hypothetical protein